MTYCDRCDGDLIYISADDTWLYYRCIDCENNMKFSKKRIKEKEEEEYERLKEEKKKYR
jgi:hypothetical protein